MTEDVRSVAVIDILGFRERVKAGELERLANDLDQLARSVSSAHVVWAMGAFGPKAEAAKSGSERLNHVLFSDSVFLWSDALPVSSTRWSARVDCFVLNVSTIILRALLRGVPLRAGLAYGHILIERRKRIIVGQPIVDAYVIEGLQDWIGGAFHPSFPREPLSHEASYPVPLHPRALDQSNRALDWVLPAYAGTRDEKDQILDRCENVLASAMASSTEHTVKRKYANTLSFLQKRRAHYDRGYR